MLQQPLIVQIKHSKENICIGNEAYSARAKATTAFQICLWKQPNEDTRDEGAQVIKELKIITTGKESNMSRLCQFLLKIKH